MARVVLLVSAALVAALTVWVLVRGAVESPAEAPTPTTRLHADPAPASTPAIVEAHIPATDAAREDASNLDLAVLRARYERSSLRGTTPDGEVAFDADGRLRHDAALVRRFEHYLSLIGEFELSEIRALLHADLTHAHGDAAAALALAAFDRYVGLRQALAETELSSDLATRLEQLRQLRRTWFGADADAMFGADEAHVRYTLARRAIESDPGLDPEQRSAQLAQLEAARAPAEREAQREASVAVLVDEQSRQFEQLGTDTAVRHEERSALWGDAAADRLAQLDRERAAWDRRVADYASERARVLAESRDPATMQRRLAELRQRRFDADERVRIEALEAVGALPSGG